MLNIFATLVAEYGPWVGFFIIFVILLRWVLHQQGKIIDQAKNEREDWKSEREDWRSTLDKMYDNLIAAHRHQQEEHEKMISSLNEMTITLARLNGRSK